MITQVVFSVIFILCVHHLLLFFQKMLTTYKEKDLLHSPIEKYQTMYKHISSASVVTPQPTIAAPQPIEMKNELKEYMVNYLHGMA